MKIIISKPIRKSATDKLLPYISLFFNKENVIKCLISKKLYSKLEENQLEFFGDVQNVGKSNILMIFPMMKGKGKDSRIMYSTIHDTKMKYADISECTAEIKEKLEYGSKIAFMAIFKPGEYIVFNDKTVFKHDGHTIQTKEFKTFDGVDEYCSREITMA